MESWQVGDVIYRADTYTEFIDAFKILYLDVNSRDILTARIESLFTGACNTILIPNDKNEDVVFYGTIYSCDINRVYEFIQKHK